MQKNTKRLWIMLAVMFLLAAVGVRLLPLLFWGGRDAPSFAYGLGLSPSDLKMAGITDVELLRKKAKAAADSCLLRHDADLRSICRGPYSLRVDYSSWEKIRKLGYCSSFYYYCLDLYLPYRLKSRAGDTYTAVVQMSDATAGYRHNPDKFGVIRIIVLDANGSDVRRWTE